MKRYCQTLTLVDDPEMIAKYIEAHARVWPEVIDGQHQVGILSMEIYRHGRSLFMIMDTVDSFDFERDMARLATLPRQAEWEAYVAQFQGALATARSDEKWQLMDKIFDSESSCKKIDKNLLVRLREFIEGEMRSCSMDLACITPEYVQRMWGGTVSLEDIKIAMAVLKAE